MDLYRTYGANKREITTNSNKKEQTFIYPFPNRKEAYNFPFKNQHSEWLELTLFFLKECLPLNFNRSEKRLALF